MGSFSVSVEMSLLVFFVMLFFHVVGMSGVAFRNRWLLTIAVLGLLTCLVFMPLVWALPSLFAIVFWRAPFNVYAMPKVAFYVKGGLLFFFLFAALPATIDPKSDGDRSSRSFIYFDVPLERLVYLVAGIVAFCCSFGIVVYIHRHQEFWTANLAQKTTAVFFLSALQRLVGYCVAASGSDHKDAFKDFLVSVAFFASAILLFKASFILETIDERQPLFFGPGVLLAGVVGLTISWLGDQTIQQLELYQLVFTAMAWFVCLLIALQYLKRYRWISNDVYNPIGNFFTHWLVVF